MGKLLLVGVLAGALAVPAVAEAHTLTLGKARRVVDAIGRSAVSDPSTPWVAHRVGVCERRRRSPHQASCLLFLTKAAEAGGGECYERIILKFRSPRSRQIVFREGNAVCP